MGSPYSVHKQVNRIHVVKSVTGFARIRDLICRSMGHTYESIMEFECGPEWVVLNDLLQAYDEALTSRSRVLVFLEARYEWTGWEKFQRVIVFDFTSKVKDSSE